MNSLFISLGIVLALALIFFALRKKLLKTPKISSKFSDKKTQSSALKTDKTQAYRALLSLDQNVDNSIRPEGYKQRNLDREIGGLEEGKNSVNQEKVTSFEPSIEDVWDKRSDEIDKVGSIDPLAGNDKESMTWRLKKIRLKIGKHLTSNQDHHDNGDLFGKNYDSRQSQGGFSQIVKARQDFDHENGGGFGR